MTTLGKMVRASKRHCLITGPILVAIAGGTAIACVLEGSPWLACLLAFMTGSVAGMAAIHAKWLRSHYWLEWNGTE